MKHKRRINISSICYVALRTKNFIISLEAIILNNTFANAPFSNKNIIIVGLLKKLFGIEDEAIFPRSMHRSATHKGHTEREEKLSKLLQ